VTKRILIADDHEWVLRGLRTLLGANSGWEICGDAADGREAVAKAIELSPDLIVMDLAMPGLDGLGAAQEIRKLLPSVPVVLNTLYGTAELHWEAAKHGVQRVVEKSEPGALIAALEELLGGEAMSPPKATSDKGSQMLAAPPPTPKPDIAIPVDPAVRAAVKVVSTKPEVEKSKPSASAPADSRPGKSF
jgi:DNA-binding NarL/FixJ family response regulator